MSDVEARRLVEDVETIEVMASNLIKQVGRGPGAELAGRLMGRVRLLSRAIAGRPGSLPIDPPGTDEQVARRRELVDLIRTDRPPIDPDSAIEYAASAELERSIATIYEAIPAGCEMVLRRADS